MTSANPTRDGLFHPGVLAHLPLRPEALTDWQLECDLHAFLQDLFDTDDVLLRASGQRIETNYRVYGDYLFLEGLEKSAALVEEFEDAASASSPSRASTVKEVLVPDLGSDAAFGLALKSLIAWEGTTSQVLSEAAYFSLSHVLEAQTDLQGSVRMASLMYYKHAILGLRGFLETMVLPLVFIGNPVAFADWQAGSYHTPALRGKKGVLRPLVTQGTLDATLADAVSDLYGELNSYVHGAESRLVHGGLHRGAYRGHVFLADQLAVWAAYVSRCVDVGIRLMAVQVRKWESERETRNRTCSICHGETFTDEEVQFAGKTLVRYTCSGCQHVTTLPKSKRGPGVAVLTGEDGNSSFVALRD